MDTHVTKVLDFLGVKYTLKTHDKDALTCEDVAREREVRLSQVLKCLVCEDDNENIYILLLPGSERLLMEKVHTVTGCRKIVLMNPNKLSEDYKLKIGGVSPFHFIENVLRGEATFLLSQTILKETYIDISTGELNAGVLIKTKDAVEILNPLICDIT
jgi:prolyl-tRNA editing enzyme YbaK/EbsC (Cys-tRNA(Pro) deacylase)